MERKGRDMATSVIHLEPTIEGGQEGRIEIRPATKPGGLWMVDLQGDEEGHLILMLPKKSIVTLIVALVHSLE